MAESVKAQLKREVSEFKQRVALNNALLGRSHLKYKNRPVGGYSSTKEARRAAELKLLQKAGKIRDLKEQVSFVLIPAQIDPVTYEPAERPCRYIADFTYRERASGPGAYAGDGTWLWLPVVEDVKSPASRTAEYIIKRKLMLKVHGIRIRET